MTVKYYQKKTKKDFEKKHVIDIKIFLKKKKTKSKKEARETYQNFSEEEKEKKVQKKTG